MTATRRRISGGTRPAPGPHMTSARAAAYAGVARQLSRVRTELLHSIPFGAALPATRFDLERVASPVVAVTGAFSAGKTSLINRFIGSAVLPVGAIPTTAVPVRVRNGQRFASKVATSKGVIDGPADPREWLPLIQGRVPDVQQVVVRLPQMSNSLWEWLDLPGTNTEGPWRQAVGPIEAGAADICLLVTSALQPLSLTDVRQLLQLNTLFAERTVIAVSRWDQVVEADRAAVRAHVAEVIHEALPGSVIPTFFLSAKTGEGFPELASGILAIQLALQKSQLDHELSGFKRLLADLQKLLSLKALGFVQPSTVSAAREALLTVLLERGVVLKRQLPAVTQQIEARLVARLPNTQRTLFNEGRALFDSAVRDALGRIGAELFGELRRQLTAGGRGASPQSVDEALRAFTAIGQFGLPDFVDPKSALAGAGVAAFLGGALAALSLPLAGIAGIAVASGLAGGLLGGYLGDGEAIGDVGMLRRSVLDNLSAASANSVEGAIHHARHDIEHFCELMAQAAQIFSRPDNQATPTAEVQALIRVARREVDALQANFTAAQFSVPAPP